VKIYIDRDTSSEYSATDLYEDWGKYMVEAEMSDADWLEFNKVVRNYWDFQDKLEKLYEAGKGSLRGDKK
jgi:tryptophan 2,3-dioxygenase